MHGPAQAPPHRPPSQATAVVLRVVFVAVAVLSLGFLAWVALLRAATVQRRPLGWWVFGADLLLVLVLIAVGGSLPENDWRTNTSVVVLLLQIPAAVAYYLVVDLKAAARHTARAWTPYPAPAAAPSYSPQMTAPYAPPMAQTRPAHFGDPRPGTYPAQPEPPGAYAAQPEPPGSYPAQTEPPAGYGYPPPQPHPQPGHPQRIDRVRAELDELSDYLRKEDGR